jgi:hypothetical protein
MLEGADVPKHLMRVKRSGAVDMLVKARLRESGGCPVVSDNQVKTVDSTQSGDQEVIT